MVEIRQKVVVSNDLTTATIIRANASPFTLYSDTGQVWDLLHWYFSESLPKHTCVIGTTNRVKRSLEDTQEIIVE